MNILLIGSGGREHALAWKLAQSPLCDQLYAAPGNPGVADYAACVPIGIEDGAALAAFAREKGIDLAVIGPEGPLVAGVADALRAAGVAVFGPSAAAAQLEGSKGFMKDIAAKYGVPTASYGRFTDLERARNFIRAQGAPIVVKADGLAAGKGVIIAQTTEEAEQAAAEMLSGAAFGAAGTEIVIEEFLDGEEISFFAIADGTSVLPLASAQDHKRVGDGDTGPNTGGMGAYSPARLMTPEMERTVMETIILPTVAGMKTEGCPFTGVLFAGLMVVRGQVKLLEFNVRFGDPECQTLMMRLESDLVALLHAAATGTLAGQKPVWSTEPALCVVMAATGYPGTHVRGTLIRNLPDAAADCVVFHAGTAFDANGALVNSGGRVLGVTARAETLTEAREKAYAAVDRIDWADGFCRRDIGWRAL